MSFDLAAIRQGLADACSTIDDLNCYTTADTVTLPALIVGRPEFTRHVTFGASGRSMAKVGCWLAVQAHEGQQMNDDLDRLTVELVDAIEADRTLGGACETLQIPADGTQPGQLTVGAVAHPAIEVRVEVWGTK